MPACSIAITFDRGDRRYVAGEAVAGTVSVHADSDVRGNALIVEHYWQTHGKGNKDMGPRRVVHNERKPAWRSGRTYGYAFRLPAPSQPLTYRGHHLNIDHYIRARADLPWARDAKHVEDFLVVPDPNSRQGRARPKRFDTGFLSTIPFPVIAIGVGVITLGSIPFLPMSLLALPIVGFLAFKGLRNTIAGKRLGEISAQLDATVVSPKDQLPVRVRFRPRQFVQLNSVTATLVGGERCVSGSGSNRTTHKRELYQRTTMLVAASAHVAGDRVHVEGHVPIPDTTAYTFESNDNRIEWSITVRIDVADWPDWVRSTKLRVGPGAPSLRMAKRHTETAGGASPDADPGEAEPGVDAMLVAEHIRRMAKKSEPAGSAVEPVAPASAPAPSPEPAPETPSSSPPPPAPVVPPDAARQQSSMPTTSSPFNVAIGRIREADRFTGERDRLVEQLGDEAFTIVVAINRIDWTFSFDVDEAYRNGRTAVGTLDDQQTVLVRFENRLNEQIDDLDTDLALEVTGIVWKWDDVHNRPEILVSSHRPVV